MKKSKLVAIAAGLALVAAPLSAVAASKAPVVIPTSVAFDGTYIVTLSNGADVVSEAKNVRTSGAQVKFTYTKAIKGFAAKLNKTQLQALAKNPNVVAIEADQQVSLYGEGTQSGATWGLDRIDQASLPLDSSYSYAQDGTGVTAYVIDTGVNPNHIEFTGRMGSGYSAINDGRGTVDCDGHGTHVAGTIGGTTYGVAKNVTIVPVRVLDCSGSGTWSGVIAGIDWVRNNSSGPSVANMSLGGGASSSVDTAVANLVDSGVVTVVAAGNSNANACNSSPARAPKAITVGATTNSDYRATYSNYGSCLDVFAPGSTITSAWYSSNSATNTISGTSMASPHVAGAMALYLDKVGSRDVSGAETWLKANASSGKVNNAGTGSPNLLLTNFGLTNSSPSPTPTPTPTEVAPSAVTNLKATLGTSRVNLSWRIPADQSYTSIEVWVSVNSGTATKVTTLSSTATGYTYSPTSRRTNYAFTVRAVNNVGTADASVSIRSK